MTRVLLVWVSVIAFGCGGEPAPSGLDEPLRVSGAAFKAGSLPGDAAKKGSAITAIETPSTVIAPRHAGSPFKGRVTDDAYAIAFALDDLGSGYWLKPAGAADRGYPGELTWDAVVDFAADLPAGNQVLRVVAIDGDGVAGPQTEFPLCVVGQVDPSRNACDPTVLPPAAVIALTWDSNSDLDLALETPDGVTVDARHPATVTPQDGKAPDLGEAGVGRLEPDSNPDCSIDALGHEGVTWKTAPEPGTYLVYANLFEACGKPSVHFKLAAYVRVLGDEPDTYRLVELQPPTYGVLLAGSANGGKAKGVFVTSVELPP